ncbi:MAG: purine-binding chemotaxis protein CheW [Calditrichaeota bacterium]|jgi:purine-binding chemotaxis protein CheW|nr:purine-binding chemotaxis protein CheW [Deltaproteobacteria bacterium]MBT4267978.1 purine-binding chemotaxis protein CheW [Deltaproteobacteria bacterium]MBT4642208.1 purine-binding chemotaxis protein CheW [Deltaproteobacteria bacterium]MBT7617499.1 purine-binding chemotaxis protein CheW [Calditrichota bacterium]
MSQIELDELNEELDEDALKDRFLTFHLGKESYGIEIRHVTEIIVMQEITKVPNLPEFIIGVVNLRGNVISVMDMRMRFHLETKEYDDRTCIVVVNIKDLAIGLLVDTVNEVLNIPEEQVDPPPKTHSGIKNSYIMGMGKVENQVKILLDIEKILQEEELEQIEQVQ